MPAALRCCVCSRVIRSRRRINCSSCNSASHVKCWKNSTNEPFATDRTTARWCCASCNVNNGTEPIINETVRQETQNILTAQALNDLYVDNVISPENEDPDYSPCSNIQDRYFDSEDIKAVVGELVIELSKYLL